MKKFLCITLVLLLIGSVLPVFEQSGCRMRILSDAVLLEGPGMIQPVRNIRTMPHPGFPTDAQSVFMSALATADGTTVFVENIFESRFKHITELTKMGADITAEGRVAIVRGCDFLQGAKVAASDLRGGAALVVAGLCAFDKTVVCEICHIDRGYESIENDFSALGAEIKRRRT